ncbi:alpha/beta hydrolase family protein [Abyssalbus ytuae]|uniref:Alpha/beta hydrolase n=1 Tax=Abyssalbus ytuae TaxID=2926907 RepID=A0A9E7D036_9FLAO|nr:alpha/beta hydrolase [Abyssalbus ytuae]UOB18100.1 alpha/beta hydrolase [Abyssalbus ytuae]
MKKIITIIFLILAGVNSKAQSDKQIFDFEFEGITLNGVLNIPKHVQPKGIVLIVHGSGRTNAVEQEWYSDIRETMVKAGYSTYMWDKRGCGKSGGTFNYNQSVHNSASEVIAAINYLKQKEIPGCKKIGLWGISRAGWINPIVINEYKNIKFWISVSGVDDKENFNYLFEENLKINGYPKDSINLLTKEFKEGVRLIHSGADFETYMNATKNVRNNKFLNRFNNGTVITKEGYYKYQNIFMKEDLDEETGLQVYIKGFRSVLLNINCPVLALFGEKDKNVDWKKTKTLYINTLGRNTNLKIKSFPGCNHNLFKCKTGGFYEFQDNNLPWDRCDGFLTAMADWLNEIE